MNIDRKPTLLIVDDQPNNIRVLAEIMQPDYRILNVTNGMKALKIAREKRPDLILLDIMMPGTDGYQVCEELQAQPATKEIPVIFVTGWGQEQDAAKGLAAGAVDYITKPFSPSSIRARVRNHLLLKQMRDVLEERAKTLEERNLALEETSRLRDDVERITRHDLKSPLASIISLSEILLEELTLEDHYLNLMQAINNAAYRALDQAKQNGRDRLCVSEE